MTKSFVDKHPPRVNWDKLRQEPTPADLKAVPPASAEEWEKGGYIVSPLPKDVARRLERSTKKPKRLRRKKSGIAAE